MQSRHHSDSPWVHFSQIPSEKRLVPNEPRCNSRRLHKWRDRPKPQNPNLTLLTERYREKFTSGTEARRARRHAPRDGPGSEGRAGRPWSARPGDFWPRRSADQAAIPLALAFASPIAMIISSWSKLQKPIAGQFQPQVLIRATAPPLPAAETPACSSTAASDPASPE